MLGLSSLAGAQPPAPPLSDPTASLEQTLSQSPKGTLFIEAVQGTKGGPAIGAADVEVDFFLRDQVAQHFALKLDEQGKGKVSDVPLALGLLPVVRVKHAGVAYQEPGKVMDAGNKEMTIRVTCYEVTDTEPEWRIVGRQVMAEVTDEGAQVAELLVIDNPSDRTWMGGPPDKDARRNVAPINLPANSSDVSLDSGFHGWCCTSFNGHVLTIQKPMMPGKAAYRYSYLVTPSAEQADLRVKSPVFVEDMIFIIPDDNSQVQLTGVAQRATDIMNGVPVRIFGAKDVAPGTLLGLSMPAKRRSPVGAGTAPSADPGAAWDGHVNTSVVVGVGAVLILGSAGVFYQRHRRALRAKRVS